MGEEGGQACMSDARCWWAMTRRFAYAWRRWQLLQCPEEQVVFLDIGRHETGEPGLGGVDDYGYAAAKVVLLPLSDANAAYSKVLLLLLLARGAQHARRLVRGAGVEECSLGPCLPSDWLA